MGFGTRLALADAVLLAHALVEHTASSSGARALAIKGRVASHYALRPVRVSADADVLVEPARVNAVVEALGRCGWVERAHSAVSEGLAPHSVTLSHPQWPCDLDIHGSWPGALGPAEKVFDEFWLRRTSLVIASTPVAIPDRSAAILITALHALRTPSQTPRHRAEYQHLIGEVIPTLGEREQSDLRDLAVAIGAVDTARPFLQRLEVKLPPPTPPGRDEALDRWRERVGARGEVAAQLSMRARELPWSARPRFVARVVWPTARDFRLDHPEVPAGWWPLLHARLGRFLRGLRSVPKLLRGRRMAKRGEADDSSLGALP